MKIAAIHSKSTDILSENLQEIERYLATLDKQGVDFALFPEMSLCGYCNNRETLHSTKENIERAYEKLIEISKNYSLAFAIGKPQYQNENIYISQIIIEGGAVLGTHQKTHLGPTEKKTFAQANEVNIFNVKDDTMGIQLCYESHYPNISSMQAAKGANFLCFAFASPRENPDIKLERIKMYLRARAYDNSCFVIACNSTGTYGDNKKYAGVALIISPKGEVLAESKGYESGYTIFDCEKSSVERIKNSKMGHFNRYKNNEIF